MSLEPSDEKGHFSMEVYVKLVSTFAKYGTNLNKGRVALEEGDTIEALARKLGLPMRYVRLVFVNGKQVQLDSVLFQGDNVLFIPPAVGGG